MKPMRFFVDTHDRKLNTFPGKLTVEQFGAFFAKYEQACYSEAMRRAHERAGQNERKQGGI